jgi:hypothetical protein
VQRYAATAQQQQVASRWVMPLPTPSQRFARVMLICAVNAEQT